ncbi:MAG: MBL fold metallo-hydrolase [Pseudomonadota bacterium]|nr:MBL fold metallo-hydrolase [Pseudomonadota bacterium]
MQVESFLDSDTETFTHVVYAGQHTACAIIDPVLDFDPKSGCTSTTSADRVIAFVQQQQLEVTWIIETHAHADHLSAAPYLRSQLGGKVAIGQPIDRVQQVFKQLFNLESTFHTDGSQFDHLFAAGDQFQIGELNATVMHVPGHTPADMAYQIEDAVFVGDTIFMPDVGTARCDFPGGDAHQLYHSIQQLLALPPATRLYLCHDYPPQGRVHQAMTTVAAQKQSNIHVHDGITEAEFVQMRTQRDATLAMPRLILPSVQINIRAGAFPPAEDNGVHYLKIPLNVMAQH